MIPDFFAYPTQLLNSFRHSVNLVSKLVGNSLRYFEKIRAQSQNCWFLPTSGFLSIREREGSRERARGEAPVSAKRALATNLHRPENLLLYFRQQPRRKIFFKKIPPVTFFMKNENHLYRLQ